LTARGKLLAVFGESRLKRMPCRQWFSRDEAEKEKQACSNLAFALEQALAWTRTVEVCKQVYSSTMISLLYLLKLKPGQQGPLSTSLTEKPDIKSVTYDEP
jgi:hypothetical protein